MKRSRFNSLMLVGRALAITLVLWSVVVILYSQR
jgi:hypothetical protein